MNANIETNIEIIRNSRCLDGIWIDSKNVQSIRIIPNCVENGIFSHCLSFGFYFSFFKLHSWLLHTIIIYINTMESATSGYFCMFLVLLEGKRKEGSWQKTNTRMKYIGIRILETLFFAKQFQFRFFRHKLKMALFVIFFRAEMIIE